MLSLFLPAYVKRRPELISFWCPVFAAGSAFVQLHTLDGRGLARCGSVPNSDYDHAPFVLVAGLHLGSFCFSSFLNLGPSSSGLEPS